MSDDNTALFGSHYLDFQCIGDACEDTCCAGWRVDIDRDTYHRYKNNQHPALKKLFKTAVQRKKDQTSTKQMFAELSLNSQGECAFLENGLCKIQKNLGHALLSEICKNYPRKKNLFGSQHEYSLSLSCPEAARRILLDPEKMRFLEGSRITEGDETPPAETESPERFIILNDIRAVIIFTLQHRALSLDTRLLLVGLFLESIDKQAYPFDTRTIELLPQLTDDFCLLLQHGDTIEQELRQLPSEDALRLKIFAEIMKTNPEGTNRRFSTCITEAAQGFLAQANTPLASEKMVSRIRHAAKGQLAPFLKNNSHILENYLVHTVFHSLFPFTNEPLLQQYVKLVCHYLIVKTCLLGLTAFHGQMTEELTIRVIQSFSKLSEHNATYPARVLSILQDNGFTEFRRIFLLILDPESAA